MIVKVWCLDCLLELDLRMILSGNPPGMMSDLGAFLGVDLEWNI